MESLLGIHSHLQDQIRSSKFAEWVYDCALPPLVLYAFFTGSAAALRRWLEISPRNAVTVLDTHDGIGVIDVGPDRQRAGLLNPLQIDQLVEGIHDATGGQSRLATGAAASNLDIYQVNSTYYSALGCDDDRYLLARLTQLLVPGIPQVYYAGLLAAPNAMDLLERTGVGRDINRPYYSAEDIVRQLGRPVVAALLSILRWRNSEPAFAGRFTLLESPDSEVALRWETIDRQLDARIDFEAVEFEVK